MAGRSKVQLAAEDPCLAAHLCLGLIDGREIPVRAERHKRSYEGIGKSLSPSATRDVPIVTRFIRNRGSCRMLEQSVGVLKPHVLRLGARRGEKPQGSQEEKERPERTRHARPPDWSHARAKTTNSA